MRKILSNNYFFVAIYLLLAFLGFGNLPLAFFQQDEWAIIGTYSFFDKANISWFERLFTYGQNTHTIPLSGLLSNLQYKIFGLDFALYAYFSIAIHLLNSGLIVYLAMSLLTNCEEIVIVKLWLTKFLKTHFQL